MDKKISTQSRGLRATPKNIIQTNINKMYKQDLTNLTKEQLINLLLKQNKKIQLLKNKLETPTPASRKSVRQMAQDYEDNIIPPPVEFRDDYKPVPKVRTIKRPVPAPRSVKKMVQEYEKNIIPPVPKPRIKPPVPAPRTKIERVANALKGYTMSFEIGIKYKKILLNNYKTQD